MPSQNPRQYFDFNAYLVQGIRSVDKICLVISDDPLLAEEVVCENRSFIFLGFHLSLFRSAGHDAIFIPLSILLIT